MTLSIEEISNILVESAHVFDRIEQLQEEIDKFWCRHKYDKISEIDSLHNQLKQKYNLTLLDVIFIHSMKGIENKKELIQ